MQMIGYESETVLPTVIITDETGKIIWTHQTDNYRVRPEPDVFLDVLRGHGMLHSREITGNDDRRLSAFP
jgi:hypothetical protein